MIWSGIKGVIIFVAAIVLCKASFAAEVIELPQEELAKESVLPIFDKTVSVKSRSVVTQGKLDLGLLYGMALTEPIQNVSKLELSGYYHMNEDHSFGLLYSKNSSGLSTYGEQLKYVKNADGSIIKLDLTKAPYQEMSLFADYNVKAFYGKMSLTKNTVLNLSLYGSAALGVVKYVHKSYPALALGLGQKFYIDKNWALRFDMRLHAHNAPIPFLKDKMSVGVAAPSYDEFNERLTYTTNLEAGVSYLF